MSKEMTAEEFKEARKHTTKHGLYAIDFVNLAEYKELVAKEAVKEFAVSILNAISDLDAQNAIILELRKWKLM